MKRKCAFLLSLLLASGSLSFAQKAKVYTTTEQTVWKKTAVRVNSSSAKEADIIVSDCKEQLIDGFGGAFSEIGWDALSALPNKQRNGVLEDLFGKKGLKLNWGRIPLGANDFARDWYSFNETPNDFEMRNFSIERDTKVMIPYVKAALKCNPDLILWASPWSPPVWMKATKHYATSAGDHNDFTKENEVEGDHFIHNRLVGIFYVNPVNLGAVGHNIADVHIGQAEYAVYQFGLFLFEGAQLRALLQKDFDFLFRYGLHLRLAHADDLRHQGRRSRQKPNEGRTDRTEIQHRPGQKAGDGFRLVDGDALRHDFP